MSEKETEQHWQDTASVVDVPGMASELHTQLLRYIEAQYPLRHPEVIAERNALLQTAGVIARAPFIESMPGYQPGPAYEQLALPSPLTQILHAMSSWLPSLLPTRLYQHQAEALETFLMHDRDLIVVTGTGSGKTETFLLPMLLRSMTEAATRPESFRLPGMRALLLYPMNALVNDQLIRLRQLFCHPRLTNWFLQQTRIERPARFGMYTSRTPYPGVLSKERNKQQLLPLLEYYHQLEVRQPEQARELKQRGRWPALDLAALRQATLEGGTRIGTSDVELYTRQQIQQWCPDVLVTNYSMLEYMLMRPIEQKLFQQTANWLEADKTNTLLIVLDEAHLYNGVTGAEISLLLRRLQARLGINRERVRYILTSASLDLGEHGSDDVLAFASDLVGTRSSGHANFAIIQGKRLDPPHTELAHDPRQETEALAQFNLRAFTNRSADPAEAQAAVTGLACALHWPEPPAAETLPDYLGQHLPALHIFQQLWKITAGSATSFQDLAGQLFPHLAEAARGGPTSALLSLAAAAITGDERPLLPVRAHLFFRGLPPVYACINPRCSARRVTDGTPGPLGALWLSPRLHCECGARVYELYAHRNCGTLFLRAFAADEQSEFYWHEGAQMDETLLLVGKPHPNANDYEEIDLHLLTGQAFPVENANPFFSRSEEDFLRVYRARPTRAKKGKSKPEQTNEAPGNHWKSCPVCRKRLYHPISGLATKGEQPFVNLVRRQFELQPPSAMFQEAAPNSGRKMLLFSDGRQRAARLARDLPREVELDSFRQALILAVAQRSARLGKDLIKMDQGLYDEFIHVCATHHLYFFDGESQKDLLHKMQDFRASYDLDIEQALEEEWAPAMPQGYRLALLRQVADPFYSMQRMCAAVVEPSAASLKRLKRKPLFERLTEQQLRALTMYWIEELLNVSAFDAKISPHDRENTVRGETFAYTGSSWNDAEKAAKTLLGYHEGELALIRQFFIDELCEKEQERAFLLPEKLAIRLTLDAPWHQCQDCTRLTWLPLNDRCLNSQCGSSRLIQLPGNDPSLRARTDFYREPIRQVIAHTQIPRHLTAEEHSAQLSYRDKQQVSTTTEDYELRFQDIGISTDQPSIDVLSCTTTMEVGIDIGSLLGIGLRAMPPRRANYQQRAGRAGRRSASLSTVLTYSENGSHDAHYFAHPAEMISGSLPAPHISPINQRLLRRHIQAALIQTFFIEQTSQASTMSNKQYGYLAGALGTTSAFFAPTGSQNINSFEQWLQKGLAGQHPALLAHITAWLPASLTDSEAEKQRFVREIAVRLVSDLRSLGEQLFPKESAATSSSPASEQAFVLDTEDMLLDILFEHDFLPAYAFPREVRSFVIEKWKQNAAGKWRIAIEQRPQQSVDIALSEYAPGRELVVNKATYRVGGIYLDPSPGTTLATRVTSFFQQPRQTFALCTNCGYTVLKKVREQEKQPAQRCPMCHKFLVTQEILDPPGYAPEGSRSLEQSQVRNDGGRNGGTTPVQLVLPPTHTHTFSQSLAEGRIAWSKTEHHQLLLMNTGEGQGFAFCRTCGARASDDPEKGHDRPFLIPAWMTASKKCYSPDGIWRGYLGHVFYSDLFLLRLQWPAGVAYQQHAPWMRDALYTLAQALLLATTQVMDISLSELQTGWSYAIAEQQDVSEERVAYLFLFDTLSGGAGYATQAGQYMEQLLRETQDLLDGCPDRCERSCYRCLRTYQNRIHHERLDRKLAGSLLRAIVSGRAPDELSLAQQIDALAMLQAYLQLNDVPCEPSAHIQGVTAPLLVKTRHQTLAIGVYSAQQDLQVIKHSLDALPPAQVKLFSEYDLAHALPQIARMLL